MKRKLISFFLLMMAAMAFFGVSAAAADAVDEFAAELRTFQTEIEVPVRDMDALMTETFDRYPELYYYYNGSSYRSTPDGLSVTMLYKNTDKSLDDVFVVDSYEKMLAAVGLAQCDFAERVDIVLAHGFTMDTESFWGVFDELEQNYYLIYMGYHGRTLWTYAQPQWNVSMFSVELNYWDGVDQATARKWRNDTQQKVLELSNTLFAQDMPDYQKVYLIHDYLVDNCYYNMDDINIKQEAVNHVAYGCLVEGFGVCQSYAEAFQLLCHAANIPCYYIVGDAGGSHAWNCVELDGEWYLVDATWDDPVTSDGSQIKTYDHFLVTAQQLGETHTWEQEQFPVCDGGSLNADRVKELISGDTNTYTDYSQEYAPTQEKIRAEFLAVLQPEEPVLPEDTLPTGEEPVPQPGDDSKEPTPQPGDDGKEPTPKPIRLEEVILIDEEKQELNLRHTWLVVLIILILIAAVSVITVRCIANSRIMEARTERFREREERIRNNVRTDRRL